MEIEPQRRFNNNYITFTYTTRKVRGYILSYNINNHTIMLKLDGDSQQSNPTRKSDEIFNINMISECILEKRINDHISNGIIIPTERHYKSKYEIRELHTNIQHKLIKKTKYTSPNDNIDFID